MIINSQLGGKTPTGTKSITSNGTHNVADYEYADVNVPTTAPAYYIEKTKDANGKLINSGNSVIDLTVITDVGDYVLYGQYYYVAFPSNTNISFSALTTLSGSYAMYNCFAYCTGITSVSFPSLITVSGNSAMYGCFPGCANLTSLSFPSLITVSGNSAMYGCFTSCANLTSLSFPSLTTVSGGSAMNGCFTSCANLTSLSFPSLTTVSGGSAMYNCFAYCTGITSVSFPSLTAVSGNSAISNCFSGCANLTSLSFPALTSTSFGSRTNQFNNMLSSVTGCTVHFPSNLQSVIGSWSDVTAGFGGTNTTVLFDLPATA